MGNNIDVLTPRSVAGCVELEYLNLFNNNIVHIPPNTFADNPELETLGLGLNQIETLHPLALFGTAIEYLDLSLNRISVFDPTWYETINGTLHSLDLLANGISSLPSDGFRTLRDIEVLVLNYNPLRTVPGNAFISLDQLETLLLSKF